MLAAESSGSVVLIDCGSDPVERLLSAGVDPREIDLLILTHAHPDHVCGFPLLMQKLWLAKRSRPLEVLGPREALDTARRLFEVFDTSGWDGLPELRWHEADSAPRESAWTGEEWAIDTTPAKHGRRPTIALQMRPVRSSGGTAVYSADTEYSQGIVELARGARLLVHEATGEFPGHSTAEQAARVAAAAGVDHLVLVHLPPEPDPVDLAEAQRIFPAVETGEDGSVYTF